jgi:hypothetical protein
VIKRDSAPTGTRGYRQHWLLDEESYLEGSEDFARGSHMVFLTREDVSIASLVSSQFYPSHKHPVSLAKL